MENENGGVGNANVQNGDNENANETTKQIDELKAQLETLKKESSGKDRKIAEFLKEQELNKLNSQSEKEQLATWKAKAELYERKEAYRQSFKEVGLNPDEFESIVDEKDFKVQATRFADLLKSKTDAGIKTALEEFKKKELEKKAGVPETKTNKSVSSKYAGVNDAIRNACGR